jgi:hypothetical protein
MLKPCASLDFLIRFWSRRIQPLEVYQIHTLFTKLTLQPYHKLDTMPPKGSKAQAKEQTKTPQVPLTPPSSFLGSYMLTSPQKTKADAKTATPTKTSTKTPTKTATKQTPKKEEPKKEEPKPVTPKKPKPATKYTKLARNKNATLPVEITFQGDILQAKQVKANYTHALKLDAAHPFTLVDTASLHFSCLNLLSLTLPSTLCRKVSNMKAIKSSSSSRPRPSSS